MILFVISDTEERMKAGAYFQTKFLLEELSCDHCLIIHFSAINEKVLRDLQPWAVVHSGSATDFRSYGILEHTGYKEMILHSGIPQLGICGGHQAMGCFFGSLLEPMRKLRRNEPDPHPDFKPGYFAEKGMFPVKITVRDPLFRTIKSPMMVPQSHSFHLKQLSTSLELIAEGEECQVQAFRHKILPLYGVQFHPERATEAYPDGWTLLKNFFTIARKSGVNN